MRDPDLVVRAQQAATALESAWRRWRRTHGLAADPVPPVSSYVGYSLEAPWGQARIVLGICAEEAEQLARLLERHDCVGPVHASVTARPVGRAPGSDLADAGQPGAAGILRVPAPAPASAGQQPLSLESAFSRQDPGRPELASEPRRRESTAASELTKPFAGNSPGCETPIALAASRAVEASTASRKKAMNGSSAAAPEPTAEASAAAGSDRPQGSEDGRGPGPAGHLPGQLQRPASGEWAERTDAAAADAATVDAAGVTAVAGTPVIQPFRWANLARFGHRERADDREAGSGSPGIVAFRPRAETSPALSALQRPTQGTDSDRAPAADLEQAGDQVGELGHAGAPGRPAGNRDRLSSAAANADAATWAASELPGQAAVTDTAV
jgi:hypothetical protein